MKLFCNVTTSVFNSLIFMSVVEPEKMINKIRDVCWDWQVLFVTKDARKTSETHSSFYQRLLHLHKVYIIIQNEFIFEYFVRIFGIFYDCCSTRVIC